MEKNPDATSSAARAANRLLRGVSSKPDRRLAIAASIWPRGAPVKEWAQPSATEDHLEHEFAAGVGEEEQDGAGDNPFERAAPAPSVTVAAVEQCREHEPRQDRENFLVPELERLAEQLLGEQRAAEQGQREQAEADIDQPEKETLKRQQRGQPFCDAVGLRPVQPALEAH